MSFYIILFFFSFIDFEKSSSKNQNKFIDFEGKFIDLGKKSQIWKKNIDLETKFVNFIKKFNNFQKQIANLRNSSWIWEENWSILGKKVHWFGRKIQEFEILSSFSKKEITNYKNFMHLRNRKQKENTKQKMSRFCSVLF